MKNNIIKKGDFFINEKHKDLSFLEDFSFDTIWNCKKFQVFRKKYYRIIEIIQKNNTKIFIKKYLKRGEEAQKEWENIILLREKGFLTSTPVFFGKCKDRAIIGTEEIKGDLLIDLIRKNPFKTGFYISKLAEFLGNFHKTGFFHQDCYFNHFFYDKNLDQIIVIDVSRVKYKPIFSKYYLIKDISQLKFSFYTYLENEAKKYWDVFWNIYTKINPVKFPLIISKLVDLKVRLIRRHTERVKARGREI